MKTSTVELGLFTRAAALQPAGEGDRIASVTFASETPVLTSRRELLGGRKFWEVLSMRDGHARLNRLNAGAPLLDNHDRYSGVRSILGGVIEGSASIVAGFGHAKVQFSQRASDVWQDVVDRVLRNLSAGYLVYRYQEEPAGADGIPVLRAIDWEAFELSMVPIGADVTAQTRAAAPLNQCVLSGLTDFTVADADRARRFRLAIARSNN